MGQPKDTRTCWQKHSLRVLILTLLKDFPGCRVCGHRDLSLILTETVRLSRKSGSRLAPVLKRAGVDKEQVSFFIYILYYQLLLVYCYWLLIKKTRTFASPGFLHLGNASLPIGKWGTSTLILVQQKDAPRVKNKKGYLWEMWEASLF